MENRLSLSVLRSMIGEERLGQIQSVTNQRTNRVVPVLDRCHDTGNINAAMRSAEAFGFGEFHIIQSPTGFKYSKRVSQGAHKWLEIRMWRDSEGCLEHFRKRGYRTVVACTENAVDLSEVDFRVPSALFFGGEKKGASKDILSRADIRCRIPLLGFSKSLNLSVAAGIMFYHILLDRLRRQGFQGDLDAVQKEALQMRMLLRSKGRVFHASREKRWVPALSEIITNVTHASKALQQDGEFQPSDAFE